MKPRFPIPDLRTAAATLRAPVDVCQYQPVTLLGPIPREGHKLKLRRDGFHAQRTEEMQRKAPRVVVTSKWTWNTTIS